MPNSTDDFSNNTLTTGSVTVGSTRSGVIELAFDVDWFRIDLNAGQTYRINLDAMPMYSIPEVPPPAMLDTYLRGIYDINGVLISNTSNDDFNGRNAQVTFTPSSTATYFIAAGAYAQNTGAYNLSVAAQASLPIPTPVPTPTPVPPVVVADDFAADVSSAGVVAVNSAVNGRIETAQDNDWFRVELTAGHTYRINLDSSSSNGSALSDTLIRGVYNQQGVYISNTTNDDFNGLNSQLSFTPTSSGVFYIAAAAYGSNLGSYRLSVTGSESVPTPTPTPTPTPVPTPVPVPPVSGDDFANNVSSSASVTVGSFSTGVLEVARDSDWFRVTLNEGQSYRIAMVGNGTTPLSDSLIRGVYTQDGVYVNGTMNDDFNGWNGDAQVAFRPVYSGVYYIAAEGYGNQAGGYRLSVADVSPPNTGDDFSSSTSTTGRITLNTASSGVLQTTTDLDWFRVELEAGQRYQIEMSGNTSWSPSDNPGPGRVGPAVMIDLPSPFLMNVRSSDGAAIDGAVSYVTGSNSLLSACFKSPMHYFSSRPSIKLIIAI